MSGPFGISFPPDVLDVGAGPVPSEVPPLALIYQRALATAAGSTTSRLGVFDGQPRLSVISFATGSGKTLSALRSHAYFARTPRPEADSYFTPRAVVRLVDRATHRPGREGPAADAESASSRWYVPLRSRLRPAEREICRLTHPDPLSPAEQAIGSRPSEAALARRTGRNGSPPEGGLAATRQVIIAFLHSLTSVQLLWFRALLDDLRRLLAARRRGRPGAPYARAVTAGARAAASRGGPRGPGHLLAYPSTSQIELTPGRASTGG